MTRLLRTRRQCWRETCKPGSSGDEPSATGRSVLRRFAPTTCSVIRAVRRIDSGRRSVPSEWFVLSVADVLLVGVRSSPGFALVLLLVRRKAQTNPHTM